MTIEFVKLNATQESLCAARHLSVRRDGEHVVVVDHDPVLRSQKRKLPRYEGNDSDVDSLILTAIRVQKSRHGEEVEEGLQSEPDGEVEPGDTWDFDNLSRRIDTDLPAVVVAPEPAPTPRRSIISEDDTPPVEVRGVTLDDTTPSRRTTRKSKPSRRVARDNRLARAFRAILENPHQSVAQQARIAEVTEPMLVYYEIQLRSIYRIIYEKHGEGVIPALPSLNR